MPTKTCHPQLDSSLFKTKHSALVLSTRDPHRWLASSCNDRTSILRILVVTGHINLDGVPLCADYEVRMKHRPKPMAGKRVQGDKSPGPHATIDLFRESLDQSAVHVNLRQDMIVVTEDRLRLDLNKFSNSTRNRNEWHAPVGMLMTEVATFVTASFHDTIGISGQQWQTVFRTLIVLTVFWLLAALIRGRGASSTDSLIERLKAGQPRGNRVPTMDSMGSR